MDNSSKSLISLIKTLEQAHDKDTGCPWLIKRLSHKLLSRYAIEEAYEVAEAIASEDPKALCDELGDLLLQVLLHADIGQRAGHFSFSDICKNLENKVIRRHPHVFEKPQKKLTEEEIVKQWSAIKKKEKAETLKQDWMSLLTKSYPSTTQSLKIGKKAKENNFDWSELAQVFSNFQSEVKEAEESLLKESLEKTKEEIGDVYFSLGQVCRHLGLDPEETAFLGNQKFCKRMDKLTEKAERPLSELTLADLQKLWEEVKNEEAH